MYYNTICHYWSFKPLRLVYQQLGRPIVVLGPLRSVGSVMQSVGIAYHFEPNLHTIVSG